MKPFVFASVLAACSHDGPPPPAPAPAPPVAAAPVQKLSSDFGSCELDGEKITPTVRAVSTKYWAGDDDRAPVLSVNCVGKTGRMSFASAPGAAVPYGPKTYKLDGGRGELVVFARSGDKQLAAVSGTIDVTAFDGHHFAGTFELSGSAGAGKLALSGSFDFPCHGGCGGP